jgi:hypothetical protein
VTDDDVLDTSIPHSARVWNYWLGGKDNYEADRAAADAFSEMYPGIGALATQSRQFLCRAVRYLAVEAGIRQFLDIGTGLPTMDNTHEVAQRHAPDARIVYVDNDPLVLVTARALLVNTEPDGVTAYVDADLHDTTRILAEAEKVLDFDEPVAVMFMGVLGHVADFEESRAIVADVLGAVPSGSYLLLWDGTTTDPGLVTANEDYAKSGGVPYIPRDPEQIGRYFADLELVDPGVRPVSLWRINPADVGEATEVAGYGAVGRKR